VDTVADGAEAAGDPCTSDDDASEGDDGANDW
jgi:hypothetical protein